MHFVDTDEYISDETGTKVTCTLVEHMGCAFYGSAVVSPDEPNPSTLFGGRLSEARAVLHALQYERNVRQDEFHTIENLVKACSCTKAFDKESPSAKVLFHQLNVAEKRYKVAKEKIAFMKKSIKQMMDDRDRFFEKRAKEDNK